MDERHHGSTSAEKKAEARNGYLSREDYWRAQYEKEKELNNRFDVFEESLERNIKEMIRPVAESQDKMLERMGSLEQRIVHLDGRIVNVETMKDQKFKKSLEHIVTGRNLLIAVVSGGTIFGGVWSWLLNFFQ